MKSFGFSGIFGHGWSSILGVIYGVVMAGLVAKGYVSAGTAATISTVVATAIALLFKGSNPPPPINP